MRRAMIASVKGQEFLANLRGATVRRAIRNCRDAGARHAGAILTEFRRGLLAEQCYADLKYGRRRRVPQDDIPRIVFACLCEDPWP
jgi:hypothetical protein